MNMKRTWVIALFVVLAVLSSALRLIVLLNASLLKNFLELMGR